MGLGGPTEVSGGQGGAEGSRGGRGPWGVPMGWGGVPGGQGGTEHLEGSQAGTWQGPKVQAAVGAGPGSAEAQGRCSKGGAGVLGPEAQAEAGWPYVQPHSIHWAGAARGQRQAQLPPLVQAQCQGLGDRRRESGDP